jgi:hypothetical protein
MKRKNKAEDICKKAGVMPIISQRGIWEHV